MILGRRQTVGGLWQEAKWQGWLDLSTYHPVSASVVVPFEVEAALRRHVARQPTDKLAATTSNCTTTRA